MVTREDLAKTKNLLSATDIIQSCTSERNNTKWKHYKLMNVTNVAALLRTNPMVCKDNILPEPLLKNRSIKNWQLRILLEIHTKIIYPFLDLWRCISEEMRDSRRKHPSFNLFLEKKCGTDPANGRGVCNEDISTVEGNVRAEIFLYDIDIIDGSMIGDLARRSVGKYYNTVRLIR